MPRSIQLKRAYEPPSPSDGQRILVERLWPRGVTKSKAKINLWLKDIAPSPELRKWYSHDVAKWPEFKSRYRAELRRNPQAVAQLRTIASQHPVTLIYAARDEQHNSAVVLKDFLERNAAKRSPSKRKSTARVSAKRTKRKPGKLKPSTSKHRITATPRRAALRTAETKSA